MATQEEWAVKVAKLEASVTYLEKKHDEDISYLERKVETAAAVLEKKIEGAAAALEKKIEGEVSDLHSRIKHVEANSKSQFQSVERVLEKKIEEKDIHWIKLLVFGMVALILTAFGTALVNTVFQPHNPAAITKTK